MSYFKKREGKKHYEGKIRLGSLFMRENGYHCFYEVKSIENTEYYDQPVDYYFDVLLGIKGYKNYEYRGFIIAEVDGRVGHRTLKTDSKAHKRDTHFFEKYGIPTARFATEDLVGSRKLTDSEIMDEMDFQVQDMLDEYKPYYCFICKEYSKDKFCQSCRLGAQTKVKLRTAMSGPHLAPPSNITIRKNGLAYLRRTIALPNYKRYVKCDRCNTIFNDHSFAGCSKCDYCITGIIFTNNKKDS